ATFPGRSPGLAEEYRNVERSMISSQLQQDNIDYLLVQFVDVHGAPKVKMVPRGAADAVTDSGAGFAGGAVWGMGPNASSHDLPTAASPPGTPPAPTRWPSRATTTRGWPPPATTCATCAMPCTSSTGGSTSLTTRTPTASTRSTSATPTR